MSRETDAAVLNAIHSNYLLSVKDTGANINALNLGLVNAGHIELYPTSLPALLTVNAVIDDLNLSSIKLAGTTINEKVYNGTGTEIDILKAGKIIDTIILTNTPEAHLQLVGVPATVPVTLV